MTTFIGNPRPRISPEIKKVLQISKQTKVGDWYLYQNHTKIKIYGCLLAPYKLPRYLPMRFFALEYYRKIINADEVNFVNANKKANFKIKDQLGPFICNSREAGEEANLILKRMKFQRSLYGDMTLGIHYQEKKKVKLGPFIQHPILVIEAYANQTEWVEATLVDKDNTRVYVENSQIDLEKQLDESTFLQVPKEKERAMRTPPIMQSPQNEEKIPKRNKEGASTSEMDTLNLQQETSRGKGSI